MKRFVFFGLLCLCLMVPKLCLASLLNSPTVAVLPFSNKAVIQNDLDQKLDLDLICDYVSEDLGDAEFHFQMVERRAVDKLLDEMYLGNTGLIDPSTAAKIGKMLGAQYVVIGSVTGLSTKTRTSAGSSSYQVFAHVSARMVEVETGRIAVSGRGTGKSEKEHSRAPSRTLHIGTESVSDEDVHMALQQAADDAVYGTMGMVTKLRGKSPRR